MLKSDKVNNNGTFGEFNLDCDMLVFNLILEDFIGLYLRILWINVIEDNS